MHEFSVSNSYLGFLSIGYNKRFSDIYRNGPYPKGYSAFKMNSDWKHIKTIVDGDPFIINGLNIWDFDWKRTGQGIKVKDPLYGQVYTMPVFEISNKEIKVIFAAGEFSNCIWGIYRPQ